MLMANEKEGPVVDLAKGRSRPEARLRENQVRILPLAVTDGG
jgi:hypothetical protein